MKKSVLVLVPVVLGLLAASAVMAAGIPSITVKKAPAKVTIDGKYDAEWANATLMTVGENDPIVAEVGKVWAPAAGDCKVYIMWDKTYLYFLADKVDDFVTAPITDPGAGAPWLDDSIGMFLCSPDGTGFKVPISVPTDDGTMLMGWAPIGPGSAGIRPEIGTAAFAKTKTGYIIEAQLKWSEISDFSPKVGDVVKFTPLVMDRHGDDSWGQTMWVGDGDNPDVYADLKFVD